jgi:hypothetical protein
LIGQPKERRNYMPNDNITDVKMNIFDEEEIHHNCTVQILTNSITGEVSIGWWREGKFELEEEK